MRRIFVAASVFACFTASPALAGVNDNVPDKKDAKELPAEMRWELLSATDEPADELLDAYPGQGHYGKLNAYYHELFNKAYLTKEEVAPGDPTRRTVIRKPDIYNSARAVEKTLGKAVKSKRMTSEESDKRLCHVLEVCLAAIDTDTRSLETALRKHRKDPELLLAIFDNVSLTSIYK